MNSFLTPMLLFPRSIVLRAPSYIQVGVRKLIVVLEPSHGVLSLVKQSKTPTVPAAIGKGSMTSELTMLPIQNSDRER